MAKRLVLAAFILIACSGQAFACVGKTLVIGSLASPPEKSLSHLLAVLINERTGTTVNVEQYESQPLLYQAAREGRVHILVDHAGRALELLGEAADQDQQGAYLTVKKMLRDRLDLVALDGFGTTPPDSQGRPHTYLPVVTEEVLADYPALPRVIKKLAGIAEDPGYLQLLSGVRAGEKPQNAARAFLKSKRFI